MKHKILSQQAASPCIFMPRAKIHYKWEYSREIIQKSCVLPILSSPQLTQGLLQSMTSQVDDKGNYKLYCLTVSYNIILSGAIHKKGFHSQTLRFKRSFKYDLCCVVLGINSKGQSTLKHIMDTSYHWGRGAPFVDTSKWKRLRWLKNNIYFVF